MSGLFQLLSDTERALRRILTPAEKRRYLCLTCLSLVSVIFEVVGVASILPVMIAAMRPEFIQGNRWLRTVYAQGGFTDERWFLVALVVTLFTIFLFKNLFALFVVDRQSRFSFGIANRLSRNLFLHYLSQPYQFHKNTSNASLVDSTINGPGYFAPGIVLASLSLLTEASAAVLLLAGMFFVNPNLVLLLVVVLGPPMLVIYTVTRSKIERSGLERVKLMVRAYDVVGNSMRGYLDIRMTSTDRFFSERYGEVQAKVNEISRTLYILSLVPSRAIESVAVLGLTVIYTFSLFALSDRHSLVLNVTLFAAAASRLVPSLNRSLMAIMSLRTYHYTIQEVEKEFTPKWTAQQQLQFEREIEFKAVTFKFQDATSPVLSGIDLTVKRGEIVGFIGESGSGKTTLMLLLLRVYRETGGEICVDGNRLTPDVSAAWQQSIGYVRQDVFLLGGSLRENIAFGQPREDVDEERVVEAVRMARLEDWVQTLHRGLDTEAGEFGSKLSGGQRQRIAIARALYKKVNLLVFDEATSALDSETESAITESIQAIANRGFTIFIIAHRHTTLRPCHAIYELRNGRIVGRVDYRDLTADVNSEKPS